MHTLLKNPIFLVIRTGWQYAGRYRLQIIVFSFMFAISQAFLLLQPYVIGKLINSVQANINDNTFSGKLWHDVCFYAGLYLLLEIAFWLFHGPGRILQRIVAYHIKANYKKELVHMLTLMPLQWHREQLSGENIDKIKRASTSLFEFFDYFIFEISYALFRFVGAVIILFYFMPSAGYIALLTTVITIAIVYSFDRYLFRQYEVLNKFENKVAAAIQDYITNISTVITLRLESRIVHEIQTRLMAALPVFKKNAYINETKWFLTNILISGLTSGLIVWYAYSEIAHHRAILAGTFFALFEYLRRIGESFFSFGCICSTVISQTADIRGAETIIDSFANKHSPEPVELAKEWKTIAINNLHFKYEDEEHREHHLDDISICLEKGKSIAFVGESGSGKSTLLSILRGIHHTERVTLQCDGHILPSKLRHLANVTTLIPQNPELSQSISVECQQKSWH